MGRYLLLWLLGVPIPILFDLGIRRTALKVQQRMGC